MSDEKTVKLRYITETPDGHELAEFDAPADQLERGELDIRRLEQRRYKGDEARARIRAWEDEISGGEGRPV